MLGKNAHAAPARRGSRLPAIEIARGLASLWVVLFHSLTQWPPEELHPLLRFVRGFTEYGWLGVHIFFALSGWCIAERLAAAQRREEPPLGFLRERFLRIFPTYWAALALLLLVRAAAQPLNHTSFAQNFPQGATEWMANLLLINPYVGAPVTLIVSWSLVFELGFYIMGAGALVLRRLGLPASALMVLGLGLCAWPWAHLDLRATYVVTRWPEFFAGVWAWWCARSPHRTSIIFGIAGFALMAGLAAFPATRSADLGFFVASLTAIGLWVASKYEHAPTSRLSRALTEVGLFSYSLYLVHITFLSPLMNLGQHFVPTRSTAFVAVWLAALAVAVSAGWFFHRSVEAPVERWRKRRWRHAPAPKFPSPEANSSSFLPAPNEGCPPAN